MMRPHSAVPPVNRRQCEAVYQYAAKLSNLIDMRRELGNIPPLAKRLGITPAQVAYLVRKYRGTV